MPAVHNQTSVNRTDDIIKELHPLLSEELSSCVSFESKLAALFTIKEKWTLTELDALLQGTLEPEQAMTTMLQRNARTVKEANPFTPGKTTVFYIKKF